jgi:anti-sigma factor RsiW
MSFDQEPDLSRPTMAETPEEQATWRRQRDALRALHTDVLVEPIPPAMLQTLQRADASRRQQAAWWRWGGMAASVMLAFGAGWFAHGSAGLAGTPAGNGPATLAFAQQAAVAHVVYAVEQRHPVEVSASEQDHLVQWLSKRLGKPLRAPDLQAERFELMGGRLLPGGDGARAQFMYQGAGGSRLTLYVGAVQPATDHAVEGAPSSKETAFRFSDEGPVPGFYWVDQGFGYALSGALPQDQLARLARLVYQQL